MSGDDLTWIREATGAAVVTRGARIQSLWRGYGEIYRVRLDDRPAVVKSVSAPMRSHDDDPSHARKVRSYEVELEWYRAYASRCGESCRVPRFIAGRPGLFVLEDLDAAGFSGRRGDLDRCIAWLAAFHARFLRVAPAGLWEVGTYWHLETRQEELASIDDAEIRAAAPILDRKLREATFQTIVHGDAKLANFCFSRTSVAAVDFQYVGGGCGVRDVAYLLSGEPDEARHLDAYFAHLRGALGDRAGEVEREWRALYPIAAADFYRFLAGWSKEHWRSDAHGQRVMRDVLRSL
jgi:hypothetical protein